MSQVYCFTGLPGAGKSAASSIISEAGFPVVEMGNIVRIRARDALGPDVSSSEIGEWATAHRSEHGNDVFAKYTAKTVENHFQNGDDIVVIDGVRTPTELSVFRSQFDDVTVVYVSAPFETRLNRIQNRGREDEDSFTKNDLKSRDERELEWGVEKIIDAENYDIKIENIGTYDEFSTQVLNLVSM